MQLKIQTELQRLFATLNSKHILTVLIKTQDLATLSNHLEELIKVGQEPVSYEVAPTFGVIIFSGSRGTIERLAAREDVLAILANKELTIPPFGGADRN